MPLSRERADRLGRPALPSSSPFRHRDYSLFWSARFAASLGIQAQAVTLGWQVYDVARAERTVPEAALWVGLIGLAQFIPLFLLSLPAGELVDRRSRRGVMAAALAVEALCAAALASLALLDRPPLAAIFAVAALFGAARAFIAPSGAALGPMLVPRQILPRAIAANSIAFQFGSIAGPALGGLLIARSSSLSYGVTAGLYLFAAALLLLIRTHTTPERQPGSRGNLIREGLQYVWRTKIVFGAISLDLAAVLLGGATALLPVFARDVLNAGPGVYGALRAAPAVGAAIVALTLARRPVTRFAGLWMFGAVATFGLMTIVFALSRQVWLSFAALAVLGAADMVSVFIRQTLIQIVTPDVMRGRVAAVSTLFIGASNELGEFESGLVARVLGPVGAALFGGFGALAVTALWARWFPDLRRADRLE
ncbi:MAG: MFS transporter [Proteobacteria bacterium]|nr:MFS transporter [Pseudomonadota bacterium]